MQDISTLADWHTAINKYLKGQSIDDVTVSVEGIQLMPYAHHELVEDRGSIPTGKHYVGSKFSIKSNKSILAALSKGSQSIDIQVDDEIATTLKDVNLSYILPILRFDQSSHSSVISYLNETYGHHSIEKAVTSIKVQTPSIHHQYQLYETPLGGLEGMKDLLNDWIEKPSELSAFSLPVGPEFYFEIAKLRALRILYANVCKTYAIDFRIPLIITYTTRDLSDGSIGDVLIKQTCATLSAMLGGANVTQLPLEDDQSSRLGLNIQHILQLESRIHHVEDPMHGSYFIEDLTDQIVEKVWADL